MTEHKVTLTTEERETMRQALHFAYEYHFMRCIHEDDQRQCEAETQDGWSVATAVESIVAARIGAALRDVAGQTEGTGALTETVVKYLRLRAAEYDPEQP